MFSHLPPFRPGCPSWRHCALALSVVSLIGCSRSPTKPSGVSDVAATSCATPDIFTGSTSLGPSFREIFPGPVLVNVGSSVTRSACFYRDKERPAEMAAVQWSVGDTSIATVAPVVGGETTVTGKTVGRTTLSAVITGVTVSTILGVCDSSGRCPF